MARCVCGAALTPSRGFKPRRWCSEACRVKHHYQRARASEPPWSRVYFRSCKMCSLPFTSAQGATRYCSVTCRTEWHAAARRGNGGTRKYVERRRVRKMQAPSETIERLVVAERDDWACGICSEAIDPELSYPHPRSLSVDHVIPLGLGGSHTYANVRAAHLDCNVRRGVGRKEAERITAV